MSTEQTADAGFDSPGNSTDAPQQDGQTGKPALTLPQKPSTSFPGYLDAGAWEFPSSDLELVHLSSRQDCLK